MMYLSDTQRILLSSASQREGGSILPFPPCLTINGGTMKSVEAILKRELAEERETSEAAQVRRTDGDVRYGAYITAAGLGAIGVEPVQGGNPDRTATPVAPPAVPPAAKSSKAAAVLDLLRRPAGATLPELIAATGWLPHTTRAALTGIRKKGHEVERSKRGEVTCYRIVVTG